MSMRPPASRRVRTPAIALALLVIVQSGPGGLWILSWRGKRARYARCRLTPCRRRVSHNTLDAADGAHRLHRHFRRTLDQDVKIGSRRPVTLRHRKEGTDRASSLRSDERSRSPESAFTFAEISVHVRRNRCSRSAKYPPLQQHTPFLRGVSFRCRRGVNSGCRLTDLDRPRPADRLAPRAGHRRRNRSRPRRQSHVTSERSESRSRSRIRRPGSRSVHLGSGGRESHRTAWYDRGRRAGQVRAKRAGPTRRVGHDRGGVDPRRPRHRSVLKPSGTPPKGRTL